MRTERTNVGMMEKLLGELANFGNDGSGGVCRLPHSADWAAAQRFLIGRMESLGLTVRCDRNGGVYGSAEGTKPDLPVVLTGSHIDTVGVGCDGAYGIAAGIAAVAWLREKHGPPRRTIEVVSFCEEEGSRFPIEEGASESAAGTYDVRLAPPACDEAAVTRREATPSSGLGRDDRRPPTSRDVVAFVEAHIEPGAELERAGADFGIVSAIAGGRRYAVVVSGEANHAGATPMPQRKDALAGAAEMIRKLETLAVRIGDPLVATVGRLDAKPNAPNVVPGQVTFTVDARHVDEEALEWFCETFLATFEDICERRGLKLDVATLLSTEPTVMDARLRDIARRVCKESKLRWRSMTSGAGHGAQMLRAIAPTALLLVPRRAAVGCSPAEDSKALGDGLFVLTKMLYELAYEERTSYTAL